MSVLKKVLSARSVLFPKLSELFRKCPFKAVVPGFEPGQTEPKPVVLPLHHTTIAFASLKACKYTHYPLLGNEQIVVFLTAPQHDIASVNQVGLSDGAGMVIGLLLVD